MDRIEAINESNLRSVAELSTLLWQDSSLADMTIHYQEVLQAGTGTCFLLQHASGFIGFIELSIRHDYVEGAETLPVAYIEGIFVQEEYRLKGAGQLLVKHAEDWARSKGLRQLCSDTELDNGRGIVFHASAGFTEVSRIVCFVKSLD